MNGRCCTNVLLFSAYELDSQCDVCALSVKVLVHDIHVVCGCLKDFLRGLKEPLVTYRLWNAFASAAGELATYMCVMSVICVW